MQAVNIGWNRLSLAMNCLLFDELFKLARAGEFELLTSVLTHAEVAFAEVEKQQGELDPEVEAKIRALWFR